METQMKLKQHCGEVENNRLPKRFQKQQSKRLMVLVYQMIWDDRIFWGLS